HRRRLGQPRQRVLPDPERSGAAQVRAAGPRLLRHPPAAARHRRLSLHARASLLRPVRPAPALVCRWRTAHGRAAVALLRGRAGVGLLRRALPPLGTLDARRAPRLGWLLDAPAQRGAALPDRLRCRVRRALRTFRYREPGIAAVPCRLAVM